MSEEQLSTQEGGSGDVCIHVNEDCIHLMTTMNVGIAADARFLTSTASESQREYNI